MALKIATNRIRISIFGGKYSNIRIYLNIRSYTGKSMLRIKLIWIQCLIAFVSVPSLFCTSNLQHHPSLIKLIKIELQMSKWDFFHFYSQCLAATALAQWFFLYNSWWLKDTTSLNDFTVIYTNDTFHTVTVCILMNFTNV